MIEPADDLYTFTFDSSKGATGSFVGFKLSEIWTGPIWIGSPPLFIAAAIGLFLLLRSGLTTLAIAYLKSPKKESSPQAIS